MVDFNKLEECSIIFAKLKKRPNKTEWQKLDSDLLRISKSRGKYLLTVYWNTNSSYLYNVEIENEFYLDKNEFFKMVEDDYFEFEEFIFTDNSRGV